MRYRIIFLLFAIIISIFRFPDSSAMAGEIPDGKVLSAVPGQVDTYVVSLGKKAGIEAGDFVRIMRGETVLAKAVFTSVQENMGVIVTLGSPAGPIQVGDVVRFEKAGKARSAAQEPLDAGDVIRREFKWRFRGREYTYTSEFSKKDLMSYKRVPRTYGDYSVYVSDPGDDAYMANLSNAFRKVAGDLGLSMTETVNLIISFVQGLEYTSDNVTTGYDEYPRYPAETLNDLGGDCEDTSILMAAILQAMGLDIVLLTPPGHMAVGVGITDPSSFTADYPLRILEYNGRSYAYVETTGNGFRIGEIPPQYANVAMDIIDLVPRAAFDVTGMLEQSVSETHLAIRFTVVNSGACAGYFTAAAFLEIEGSAGPFSQARSETYLLQRGQTGTLTMTMARPPLRQPLSSADGALRRE